MKLIIVIVIFITGLIMIHQKQKISDLEDEIQYLARLLFENAIDDGKYCYELIADENGTIEDASGKRFRMQKIKVDNKK